MKMSWECRFLDIHLKSVLKLHKDRIVCIGMHLCFLSSPRYISIDAKVIKRFAVLIN